MDSSRILTGLSQYPVFKVQTQRGDTLPMSLPAVNRFPQPISESSLARLSETQNAPAFSAGGAGTVPMSSCAGPAPLSDRPHSSSFFQDVHASDLSVRAALISYHPCIADARGYPGFLKQIPGDRRRSAHNAHETPLPHLQDTSGEVLPRQIEHTVIEHYQYTIDPHGPGIEETSGLRRRRRETGLLHDRG